MIRVALLLAHLHPYPLPHHTPEPPILFSASVYVGKKNVFIYQNFIYCYWIKPNVAFLRLLFQSSSGGLLWWWRLYRKRRRGGAAKVYIVIEIAVMAFEVFIIVKGWGVVSRFFQSTRSFERGALSECVCVLAYSIEVWMKDYASRSDLGRVRLRASINKTKFMSFFPLCLVIWFWRASNDTCRWKIVFDGVWKGWNLRHGWTVVERIGHQGSLLSRV